MRKILIIEDDADTAKVLEKRMLDQGYEVRVAYDGYTGSAMVHREKPDLVLLDIMMPAGGGFSVLEAMKMSSHVRHIPVIVMSAVGTPDYKEKARHYDVKAYLEKPYNPAELIKMIKEILEG